MVLDERFDMVRPREHSAQIPAVEREYIERQFKGDSEALNTFVCTPTLELGVDIGSLDAILMRNIPPLLANYWQRAGRAGRQFRMAVTIAYARPASHDRAYFAEPHKMLDGRIAPPAFNLKNEPMIRKHVHAGVLTALHHLSRAEDMLAQEERTSIRDVLKKCFPVEIRGYLFDEHDNIRTEPLDVSSLTTTLLYYEQLLLPEVMKAFMQGWPEADAAVVSEDKLRHYLHEMGDNLSEVVGRLFRRLRWAVSQMQQLDEVRRQKGTLETC